MTVAYGCDLLPLLLSEPFAETKAAFRLLSKLCLIEAILEVFVETSDLSCVTSEKFLPMSEKTSDSEK